MRVADKVVDWKYDLQPAPKDLANILAVGVQGTLVLSEEGTFQVRYGLQVESFFSYTVALERFNDCMRHAHWAYVEEDSESMIDDPIALD